MSQNCQKCQSRRLASIGAKCSDACNWSTVNVNLEDGYVPGGVGIGGGDYVEFVYCLECGQIQGTWPVPAQSVVDLQLDELDRKIEGLRRQLNSEYGRTAPVDHTGARRRRLKELEEQRDRLLEEGA